ncbi:MFS transporter [Paenibacillus sp. CAA11]|uniref:MFS transporter n=1 Tax=Paenibacillus sp. CAA11 TaxID=1532905 RepID=UPI000D356A3B|nr:MFS transporter [Paenibacillus sp. CAA11]AWB46504.1 MFS transporter [Paenibacillus sp. CAA11]
MTSVWKVYVLALVSFLVGTSEYIISGILDQIAAAMGVSVAAAGQLITVFSLAYAIGTPIIMAATAKLDRRKLMLYALGLFILGNLLSFALPSFELFLAARIVMALGAGTVVVTALSIAAKIAPSGKQASSIATVTMGFTASLIIGVPLGRVIASALDWKAVFLGIGLAGLLAMVILAVAIPSVQGDAPVPLLKQFALLKNPKVALGLIITFFWLGGYSIAYTYISPYLLDYAKIPEDLLSAALLAFGIASLFGSKVGGYTADKRGIAATLLGGMGLHIVALAALPFVAHSIPLLFVFLILWSFAAWSTGPTQQYNLVTVMPESSGVMLSLNQSTMQLSMAAGAGVGGIAVTHVSLGSITWFGVAGVFIAVLAVMFMFKAKSKSRKAAMETA